MSAKEEIEHLLKEYDYLKTWNNSSDGSYEFYYCMFEQQVMQPIIEKLEEVEELKKALTKVLNVLDRYIKE